MNEDLDGLRDEIRRGFAETREWREEMRRGFEEARAEIGRGFAETQELRDEMRRGFAETREWREEMRRDFEEVRAEISRGFAETQELRDEMRRGFGETREWRDEMRRGFADVGERLDRLEEQTRHNGVLVEDLRRDVQALAEVHVGLDERVERYRGENDVAHQNTMRFIRLTYRDLRRRIGRVQPRPRGENPASG